VTETNVFQLSQPGTFRDPLTEVLHSGARALLAQVVEAEVAALSSMPSRSNSSPQPTRTTHICHHCRMRGFDLDLIRGRHGQRIREENPYQPGAVHGRPDRLSLGPWHDRSELPSDDTQERRFYRLVCIEAEADAFIAE
jgi:hypothetical protein